MTAPRCLCLAGPTASGKTAAALAVADAFAAAARPVEIVSVDSALVYRGMDIGTAKPSAAERARVPHHLIDLIDPRESYSAARFVADATRLIAEIAARGRLPLLVGGTMLYFKALFEGLDAMPAADRGVRAALAAQLAAEGLPALHEELQRVDPVTAARLAPGDSHRKLRTALGLSPYELLLRTRIQSAAEELAKTSTPIVEIALNHSFCDQSAFTQQFRKRTGMTPNEFRKRHQG